MNKGKSLLRSTWHVTLYLFVLGVISMAFYVWRYQVSLKQLSGYEERKSNDHVEQEFPKLSAREASLVGWAHTPQLRPVNSYMFFPDKKEQGKIRIGLFGCSHVFGKEAAPGHDFPSHLQHLLEADGHRNIEVINFGVSAFGFYQAFMMWNFIGREMDLDYTVFMPFSWYGVNRDESFHFEANSYSGLHARYVLEDDTVKFVSIEGKTRQEVKDNYFAMFPDWKYIRYEHKMPFFLRAVLPQFFHNRSNPFYYKWKFDRANELPDSYAMLLKCVAKGSKNLIVIANEDMIYDLREQVQADNTYFLRSVLYPIIRQETSSIYRAPQGHYSAMGNYLRAKEVFDLLSGRPDAEFQFVDVTKADLSDLPVREDAMPLFKYDSLAVAIGSNAVAAFVQHTPGTPKFRFDKVFDFQENKTASLLFTPGDKFKFATLPFLLPFNARIFLRFESTGSQIRPLVGVLNAPQRVLGQIEFLTGDNSIVAQGEGWQFQRIKTDSTVEFVLQSRHPADELFLSTDEEEQVLLASDLEPLDSEANMDFAYLYSVRFRPVSGEPLRLRAIAGQFLDVTTLAPASGPVKIVAFSDKQPKPSFLLGRYRIRPYSTEDFAPGFTAPLKIHSHLTAK